MANPLYGMFNTLAQRNIQSAPSVSPTGFSGMNNAYTQFNGQLTPGYQPRPMNSGSYMNPAMQAVQTMIPQSNIIWIDSVDEISAYPTGKGWQQWFGDKHNPYLYVRVTDANGIIQPISRVRFKIEDNQTSVVQEANVTPENEPEATPAVSDAPTRDEFEQLSKAVNTISDSVNTLVDKLGELLK